MTGTKPKRTDRKRRGQEQPRQLATIDGPAGGVAEAYRTLRTNLLYSVVDRPPKVILLTSHGPGEGKSTTCANLGVVMAQAEKKVLVLDCDLRKPALHGMFGLRNLLGVVNVLAGEYSLREAAQDGPEGLKVLTVGPVPPNPAELLSSERFAEFVEQARREFDYVLLDAPPVALVSDASILASHADGALVVLDARKTRKSSLRRAVHSLQTVGTNILGTVMNNAEGFKDTYYSNYTY